MAAPFLLTSLLLDTLPEGSRILNVASISAGSTIDFDNLQMVCVCVFAFSQQMNLRVLDSCKTHVLMARINSTLLHEYSNFCTAKADVFQAHACICRRRASVRTAPTHCPSWPTLCLTCSLPKD